MREADLADDKVALPGTQEVVAHTCALASYEGYQHRSVACVPEVEEEE